MSKTERDISSDGGVDALDELFADESFDDAFDEAIENADLELEMSDLDSAEAVDVDGGTVAADSPEALAVDAVDADEPDGDVAVDDVVAEDVTVAADTDAVDVDVDVDVDAVAESVDAAVEVDVDDDTTIETDVVDADADAEEAADDSADAAPSEVDAESESPDPQTEPVATTDADADALTTVGDPIAPDADTDTVDDDVDDDDVSDEILEELRRADIDGPVVAPAPQDDTTAAVRRPRRALDYDPAPVPIPAKVPRVLGRKPRVRKVTRVVRHVDPWSVFKIALIANLVLYVIVLTASVLLWNVANATGTVDNVERFFESFGWNSFEFNGGELYHAGWIAGLFVVIGLTGFAVLGATLFNLITDLVGGVRFTVLEEEVVETRTSPMRRFLVRRPEPEIPALLNDASGPMYREVIVDDTGANQRPTR